MTNYLLADTLFESKQYLDAAQEYETTAYSYGSHEKAAAAGYAAIVAYGKEEERLSGDAKAKVHRRAVDSSLKFAQTFPSHPESAQVLTRAATELYAEKDYARATMAAQSLLARQPPVDADQTAHRLDRDRATRTSSRVISTRRKRATRARRH